MSGQPEQRATRLAANQSLFRDVNERIRDINETLGLLDAEASFTSWACECANPECMDRIELSISEYESVRSDPARFAVGASDDHVVPTIERVVARTDRYWIVEKLGVAGEAAVSADPRRS